MYTHTQNNVCMPIYRRNCLRAYIYTHTHTPSPHMVKLVELAKLVQMFTLTFSLQRCTVAKLRKSTPALGAELISFTLWPSVALEFHTFATPLL